MLDFVSDDDDKTRVVFCDPGDVFLSGPLRYGPRRKPYPLALKVLTTTRPRGPGDEMTPDAVVMVFQNEAQVVAAINALCDLVNNRPTEASQPRWLRPTKR